VTQTLLIDLDNTLLFNDMETFLPAYLQALSTHLAPYAEPGVMVNTLIGATRRMVENRRPDCTLLEVFNEAFYPLLGLRERELSETVGAFYKDVFPTLKTVTRPNPEAVQLVEQALERGFQIAVATNPLFPRAAILHRLEWAGLSPEKYPFRLISSFEQFHFSKPHPAFLAECLGILGWPDGAVVVVGDDPQKDIRAARLLGLPAYWITQDGQWPESEKAAPTGSGSLAGLLPWLDGLPEEALRPDFSSPSAVFAILQSTPAVLDGLLRMDPAKIQMKRLQPGEWTPTEILCHLRDVEKEVNLPRLKKVLHENNPFLPGMDTDPWAEERLYYCQDGEQAFSHFITARMKLLDLITDLDPETWERSARHAILGPTRLIELVGIIAKHDRLHVQQILEK
jgi:FMN phosphatase YigB (HAD superfamily)